MGDWQPIAEAQFTREGTIADLRMPNGRVYRATWEYRGNVCAWYPDDPRRKSSIGLYSPLEFRVLAVGMGPDGRSRPSRNPMVAF